MDSRHHEVQMRYVAAFQPLAAEREDELAEYFVPPRDFDLIRQDTSVAVFSERGGGQSALIAFLEQADCDAKGELQHLWLRWSPQSEMGSQAPWLGRFLDLFAQSIIEWLAMHPDVVEVASSWIPQVLGGFIKEAVLGLNLYLGYWLEQAPFLEKWIEQAKPLSVLKVSPQKAIHLVVQALKKLGLKGVIMVVSLDTYSAQSEREVKEFLSSLPLLEQESFIVKGFFPMTLLDTLGGTAGVRSYRVLPVRLTWQEPELKQIVQRRIQWVLGDSITLDAICESPEDVWEWLRVVGESSPRTWLQQVRAIVNAYIVQKEVVSVEQWETLRLDNPPAMWVDAQRQMVCIGGKRIAFTEFNPQELRVLLYLYENPNRTVGREEIYYRAIQQIDFIPKTSEDPQYESPSDYRGRLDTILWRLRQIIEPAPSTPLLLQTKRGQGVFLRIV